MQKKKKDNHFIKQAFYEGGNTAFRKFVSENMKYPKEALKNDTEGVVHLKIDINYKGKVTNVKVMKGIGHGCDAEAVRIMKLAEYEVPANPRKLRIKFQKNVRIQFKKPKEPVKKLPKPVKPEVAASKEAASKVAASKATAPKASPSKATAVKKIPASSTAKKAMSIKYEIKPTKMIPKTQKAKPQKTQKKSYTYTINYNS